nr:protein alpha,MoFe [Clostridium pasteurianum]
SENLKDEILEKYIPKTKKTRSGHIVIKTEETPNPEIVANTRTVPGIITARGCAYAGCKGVVMGPIKDMVHITHGPIGCSFYTWGGRRFKSKPEDGTGLNFNEYVFSTDMQESDIVFGGVNKLKDAIHEAYEMFHPAAIGVYATCPVGLIGDDILAVAATASKEIGIPVHAFSCEGYKGVSQSAGHHIANNTVMTDIIGKGNKEEKKYSINVLGEYNIGGDAWEMDRVLEKIGYHVNATLTGDATYEKVQNADKADLNLVQCHRSINYIAEMMETKYGIPWIKCNFIGVNGIVETLRDMAKCFDDPELTKRTEEVIAEEIAAIQDDLDYFKEKLQGKTACLYVGGSRSHTYMLKSFGVDSLVAGFEFAHRDDYEGREVIPTIKIDADSKNIPEITVTPDEQKYRVVIPEDKVEELKKAGVPLSSYGGMMKEMHDGTILIDDMNHMEVVLEKLKPDMFFAGIKEKFVIQKGGVLSKQLHSYDYNGPYAGFRGVVNFGHELVNGIYTPAWKMITPPWKKASSESKVVVGGEA